MQITPVDQELNLFKVEHVFSEHMAAQVLATNWTSLPWQRQEGQAHWKRRRVINNAILWIEQWDHEMRQQWGNIEEFLGLNIQPYCGTAFWIDEPGFECDMHTDGELPGGLHLTWAGSGTSFYWHNNTASLRYQVPSQPNCGYIMINQPDATGYRRLLWHAMLTPVELNTFRLTTYTWITPK